MSATRVANRLAPPRTQWRTRNPIQPRRRAATRRVRRLKVETRCKGFPAPRAPGEPRRLRATCFPTRDPPAPASLVAGGRGPRGPERARPSGTVDWPRTRLDWQLARSCDVQRWLERLQVLIER